MQPRYLALMSAVLMVLASAAAAQQPPNQSAAPSSPTDAAAQNRSNGGANGRSQMQIGPGDLLVINVVGTDFSCGGEKSYGCEVRVGSSGEVSLPMVGFVRVGGLTVSDAERVISGRLSQGGFFNDPQVSVVQKEYSTQGISVLGEVQKPGIYPLLGSHTLLEAISAAGGTTPKAGTHITVVHRDRPNAPEHVDFSRPIASNVPVFPGDTVVVSKAGIVYVVGDVRMPSGLVMESSGLTVLQALAMAQGPNSTAALDKAALIRTTPHGKQRMKLPLKRILASKSSDVELQPEDIIFVPSSAAKSAVKRTLDAVVQTASGVAIVASRP